MTIIRYYTRHRASEKDESGVCWAYTWSPHKASGYDRPIANCFYIEVAVGEMVR